MAYRERAEAADLDPLSAGKRGADVIDALTCSAGAQWARTPTPETT